MGYLFTETPDFHNQRRKELLKKYPQEIRALIGNYPPSALLVVAIVASQFGIAAFVSNQSWWVIGLMAYGVGAFFNHALYVLVHEATHNLIFNGSRANRLIGMVCDFPLVAPGAMAFRKYHLAHHTKMGQFEYDADLSSTAEAKLVGNSRIMKALWVFFLGASQASRPMRIKSMPFWDRWIFANLLVQLAVIALTFFLLGPKALVYLFLSSFFGVGGLHPLAGRWIAEHFVTREGQETYSYYGPLNKVALNVGHHIEHHDVMTIPWVHLPKLKKFAPEYYNDLASYSSYPGLVIKFIMDKKLSLFSRYIRETKGASPSESTEASAEEVKDRFPVNSAVTEPVS